MDGDDDDFLYGGSKSEQEPTVVTTSVPQRVLDETTQSSNGVFAHLKDSSEENEAEKSVADEAVYDDPEGEVSADESEDDIEIILEPTARSLDFRQNPGARSTAVQSSSTNTSTPFRAPQPSLTTEYTPRDRTGISTTISTPQQTSQTAIISSEPGTTLPSTVTQQGQVDEGPDPSTLPVVTAPPSHPTINPELPGTLDGRSILDVDLNAMAEKPWRRPGSDISDWFNYGFDEMSWEAYCYRRRELGDLANTLKANVLNFAGMPEDQLSALPIEVRQMVMAGATAMMSGGGPNPGMMGAINPMMDMSGMMSTIGMGGMNGDIGMQMQPGGPMMHEGNGGAVQVGGAPEQMGLQDGMGAGGQVPGMMGMGIGGEFAMQDPNQIPQPMYPGMDGSGTPVPQGRGTPAGTFRGRMAPNMGSRGRGSGYQGRGRGRGGIYTGGDERPPIPVRPASPLPPGVPTGPRNQNKYKDRDGNAPAVDGLDYGGTNKDGVRTPSGEPEERGTSRKRRSSPSLDDTRGSKRR